MYKHIQDQHSEHSKKGITVKDKRFFNDCWNCEYCKLTFNSRKMLFSHYKICEEKQKYPKDSKGRVINPLSSINRTKVFEEHYRNGLVNGSFAGKTLSEKHKKAISNGTKKYINSTKGGSRFSKKACEYIDKLNEEKNWHLQHALNGGEFKVGRYSLDGYDKELNIAFEYDEYNHHYDRQGNLLEKDIKRQNYIIKELGCRFFRYNVRTNTLYEVYLTNIE